MQHFLEQQAQRSPEAVAVEDDARQLTYHALDQRANQLAHYLIAQGVGPNVPVGLYLMRSLDMVLGIFGILKAGGTYIPLDPRYPAPRLQFITQESQPAVILTQSTLLAPAQELGIPLLCLDTDELAIASQPTTSPEIAVTDDHLAYIMYTSGSTGQPKGIKMPRGNVNRYIQALQSIIPLRSDDAYLHVASFSFSSSVRQLLMPLSQGARLVIANAEQLADPLRLFSHMQQAQITVSDGVPSIWRYGLQALASLNPAQQEEVIPTHLRLVLLSGEPTPCALLQAIKRRMNHPLQFCNLYGQTETIGSSVYRVPPDFDRQTGFLPVGYPYAHIHAYILDEAGQEVSPGTVGELWLAGGCLTPGYLKRPEVTATMFRPNPWADRDRQTTSVPVPTLFKTGDLARSGADGFLEVAGRVDFQVKIRGMRVEVGELEATLELHPDLKEVMVVARAVGPSPDNTETQLVAYGVPAQDWGIVDAAALVADLRRFASDRLPDYMVPAHFMLVEAIPLTPSGKRDRRALLALSDEVEPATPLVPPKNDMEIQLWDIWKQLLGRDSISVLDNFFDLGGHSLLAAQLLTRVEQISGTRLPLATLLTAPSIRALAEVLQQHPDASPWPCLIPIQPRESSTHLFCVHGIFGNVLNFVALAQCLGSDQSVYALQSRGLGGRVPPLERVEEMAAHYILQIKIIQPHGPYYLAGYSFGGIIALEMAQQLTRAGEEVALVTLFDTLNRRVHRQISKRERLWHHTNLLWKQGPNYLLDKVRSRFQQSKDGQPPAAQDTLGAIFGLSEAPEGDTQYSAQSRVIHEANRRAFSAYEPQPYAGQVVLFRATLRNPDDAWYIDPKLGWGPSLTPNLHLHQSPAHHVEMLEAPHAALLAEHLKDYLATDHTDVTTGVETLSRV